MVKTLLGLAALTLLGATACGQDDLGACVVTNPRGDWCVINETRDRCSGEFTKADSSAAALLCTKRGLTQPDHVAKDPKNPSGDIRLDGDGYILVADPRKARDAVERGYQLTYRAPSPKKK
jgi:hypothetical protein